ncbi:MAG TPA: TIGR03118 family protein [Gaiellaceae bacterium]|nr:TIGR03118 family protein [Gaiellaceae bacterium]
MIAAFAVAAALAAATNSYTPQTLVTTQSDASLVNGWGLSAGPTTPWWVSDNGTDRSTLYQGSGAKVPLTVSVPGGPTGTVFNGDTAAFAGDRFLFATEGGQVLGWKSGTAAAVRADLAPQGAVFKGLTLLNGRLYATDFHNAKVDVFDSSYTQVQTSGGFADTQLPKGYAPFGIQALGGNVFVTYAPQDAKAQDELDRPGQGVVDEYTPDGALVARVVRRGGKHAPPNAPWGLATAPQGFGVFAGDLLVSNFGDGRISAYAQRNGKWVYKGQLRRGDGSILAIDGLWAIAFGNGAAAGPTTSLYFAAGPDAEHAGAFGVITADG